MNLVLVGFMGAGKTTVGRKAAEVMGAPFVDVDERIEEIAATSVAELFREFGEGGFRSFEAAAIGRVLAEHGQVVAVGGGAVAIDQNWTRIKDGNLVVRLYVDPEVMLARLGDGAGRPLAGPALAGDPGARERLLALAQAREPRYAEAPFQVDTSGRMVEEVAAEVVAIARSHGFPG